MRRVAALVLLAALLAPSVGWSQDMEKAPMVRRQITWRAGRSELKPSFGWTINDRYFHNFLVSMGYNYHLLNWLALGANVGWAFPIKTGLAENIEKEKADVEKGMSFPIPASHLGLVADARVELGGMFGKTMLMGRTTVAYDMHAILGFGAVQERWNSAAASRLKNEDKQPMAGIKPSPVVGLGMRFFVDRGVAITLDVVDHMAFMYSAADVSADNREYTIPDANDAPLAHNVMAMLSFSIMMPTETTYEE